MSEKHKHSGKTILIGILLILVAAVWGAMRLTAAKNEGIAGETNAQRIAYINSFGWETGITHTAVEEVRIPVEFDEAYEQYNALQKEQGFDLRKYRACYVKKYTYELNNYSEAQAAVPICANLLVYEGEIIGADISSSEADGLVTVLAKE